MIVAKYLRLTIRDLPKATFKRAVTLVFNLYNYLSDKKNLC